MAIAFIAKTILGLIGLASPITLVMMPKAMPIGTNIKSQLIQLDKIICLISLRKRVPTGNLTLSSMVVDSSPSPFSATAGAVWAAEFGLLVRRASCAVTGPRALIVSSCVVVAERLVDPTRVQSEVDIELFKVESGSVAPASPDRLRLETCAEVLAHERLFLGNGGSSAASESFIRGAQGLEEVEVW